MKNGAGKVHLGSENSRVSIGTCIIWNTRLLQLHHKEKILLPPIKKLELHEYIFDKLIGGLVIPLQRRVITCYFTYQGVPLRVTSVHADNIGGLTHRIKQIVFLKSRLDREKVKYEIVCGDFNTFDLLKTGKEKKALQKIFGEEFLDASEKIDWPQIYIMLT